MPLETPARTVRDITMGGGVVDLRDAVAGLRRSKRTAPTDAPRAQARMSLQQFCVTYFPHHFTSPFCDMHADIFTACDALDLTPHGRRVARIAPRKMGKTTIISLALPLQKIAFHERHFILLVGESAAVAEANLATIAQELDSNQRLLADFPHLIPARDVRGQFIKWTDRQLVFHSGATIVAKGMGARMRGLKYRQMRPDLAIIDDPESPETADTFLKRLRHKRWFGGTFMGLGASTWDIFVIGNLPHHDALIADLVRSPEWDGKLWRAINIPPRAEERYPVGNVRHDDSALWPEEWSLDRLEAYKREPNVGTLGFAREMMNDPREEEGKIFDPATFAYVEWTPDRVPTYTATAIYMDPAGGEKPSDLRRGKRDWCVMVAAGRTPSGHIEIFDVVMTRKLPDEQMSTLLDMYARWNPRQIGIEENMWKNLVEPTLRNMARERGLYPTIKATHTTTTKTTRIMALQPMVEAGVVRFARHLLEQVPGFFAQFDEFPGDFDDAPDATEGVVRLLDLGRASLGRIGSLTGTSYWTRR